MGKGYQLLDLFCCEGGASQGYLDSGLELLAGIDNDPKRISVYNTRFGVGHEMTWEEGLEKFGDQANLIHASPPCQRFSSQSRDRAKAERLWDNLIPAVHARLRELGKPYVIENVAGARAELEKLPGATVIKLNGFMFPGELQADWTPLSQEARIARESREDNGRRHWIDCRCTGRPAYFCYVQDKVPTEWTIRRDRYFAIGGFQVDLPCEQRTAREVMSVTVSPNPTMVWNKINRQSVPLKVRQEVMGGVTWMTARGVGECIPPPYARHIGGEFLKSRYGIS